MKSCVFDCLKLTFGFWGAITILGLLAVLLAGLFASTGGTAAAGLAGFVTAAIETAVGAAGAKAAIAGGTGMLVSLVGCIVSCFAITPAAPPV